MNLSARSANALVSVGINTLKDLRYKTVEDLDKIRYLGPKSKANIISKLVEYGIELKSETELMVGESNEKTAEITTKKVYNESEIEENMYEKLSVEEIIEIAENSDPKSEQYIEIQKILIQRVKTQQNIIAEQQSTIDSLQAEVNDKRRNQYDE